MSNLRKLLNYILGYTVIITLPDGEKLKARARLGSGCLVIVVVFGRVCYLEPKGTVRGLWPNDNTKWSMLKDKS